MQYNENSLLQSMKDYNLGQIRNLADDYVSKIKDLDKFLVTLINFICQTAELDVKIEVDMLDEQLLYSFQSRIKSSISNQNKDGQIELKYLIERHNFQIKFGRFIQRVLCLLNVKLSSMTAFKNFVHIFSKEIDYGLNLVLTIVGVKSISGLVDYYLEISKHSRSDYKDQLDKITTELNEITLLFIKSAYTDVRPLNSKILMTEMVYWVKHLPKYFLANTYFKIITFWIGLCNKKLTITNNIHWKENSKILGNILKLLQKYVESEEYDDQLELFANNFIKNTIFVSKYCVHTPDTLNLAISMAKRWPYIFTQNRIDVIENCENLLLCLVDENHNRARCSAELLTVSIWNVNNVESDQVITSKFCLLELIEFLNTNERIQSIDHTSFQVHALMDIHPMISDWKLMIDLCISDDLSFSQRRILVNILYYSVQELVNSRIPKYKTPVEFNRDSRRKSNKKEEFNYLFLKNYPLLLEKCYNDYMSLRKLLMLTEIFDSKLILKNNDTETEVKEFVTAISKIFLSNELHDKIINSHQTQIVYDDTLEEKVFKACNRCLYEFFSHFSYLEEFKKDFIQSIVAEYKVNYIKWSEESSMEPRSALQFTKSLMKLSKILSFSEIDDLNWNEVYDNFFNTSKPVFYNQAFISSIEICVKKLISDYNLQKLSEESCKDLVRKRNEFQQKLTEYLSEYTTNRNIKKTAFNITLYLIQAFDKKEVQKSFKQFQFRTILIATLRRSVLNVLLSFINDYICNNLVLNDCSPDELPKLNGQMICLKNIILLINEKKLPKKFLEPIIPKLDNAHNLLKETLQSLKVSKEIQRSRNSRSSKRTN